MAAQELRWLTYLLTDLGEAPRSPPVLYVDNKPMLPLCLEHRLEHRTKHIALRYFLARELQQHGQLRLAYVASQANTADVFTKALQPCDHQRAHAGSKERGRGEWAEEEGAEGEGAEREWAVGEGTEGEGAEGEWAEGERTEGERVEGEWAEGEGAEGKGAEGEWTEGGERGREGRGRWGRGRWGRFMTEGARGEGSEEKRAEAENGTLSAQASVASAPFQRDRFPPCTYVVKYGNRKGQWLKRKFSEYEDYCDIIDPLTNKVLARFTLNISGLYTLCVPIPQVSTTQAQAATTPCSCRSFANPTILYHHRLGHPNFRTLANMASKKLLLGLPASLPPPPDSPAPSCLDCTKSKLRQQPHPASPSVAAAPLDLVHMDVWGLAPVAARGGHRYFLAIVDDHSRYVSVHLLHTKAEAPETIMASVNQAQTTFGTIRMPTAERHSREPQSHWCRSLTASSATPTHHSHSGGTPSTMPPSSTTSTPTRIFSTPLPPPPGSGKHPLLAPFASGAQPPKPPPLGTPAPPSSPVAHGTRSHGPAPPLALAIRCSFSHIFPDITKSPSLNLSENPIILVPLTVQEALSGPHAAEWRAAMEGECETTTRNHSFDDETPPPGVNIVGGKWLFRVKQLPDEAPVFKAHYVAKGFSQQQYFDVFKTFSPTSKPPTALTISLSQEFYINNVLKRFEMELCTPIATPLPLQHLLTAPTVPTPEVCSEPYPELVGSLMYAMMCTRPDLAYPVSVLSRYVALRCFTDLHWKAAKRVLRYLQSTKSHCSTRSSAVSLSSCEAELYAVTMAAQETRWLTFLLHELGYPQPTPTLWCDNKSTIHLSQDLVYHTRTKHIELRHFFIRDLVQQEQLNLEYVASDCNLADLFTKPLGKVPHHRLLGAMGLYAPPSLPLVRLTSIGGASVRPQSHTLYFVLSIF
ncbi:unnamed protein product [Closterium sp. NIES-53]